MLDGWRLYSAMARMTLMARTSYRANFWLSLFFNLIMVTGELAVTLLIVHRVHGILGWTTYQVMLLYGLTAASGGVFRVFLSELHDFDRYLVNGEFDAILTRPAHTWITVVSRSVDLDQMGWVIEGVAIMAVAGSILGLFRHHALIAGAELAMGVLAGSLVWMALVTAVAALGFFTTRVDEMQPMVLYGPQTAATFPLSAYPTTLRTLFYTVLPVAFGSYVPALVVLHKGPGPGALMLCLGAGLLALALALWFWQYGVRHYTSTGT